MFMFTNAVFSRERKRITPKMKHSSRRLIVALLLAAAAGCSMNGGEPQGHTTAAVTVAVAAPADYTVEGFAKGSPDYIPLYLVDYTQSSMVGSTDLNSNSWFEFTSEWGPYPATIPGTDQFYVWLSPSDGCTIQPEGPTSWPPPPPVVGNTWMPVVLDCTPAIQRFAVFGTVEGLPAGQTLLMRLVDMTGVPSNTYGITSYVLDTQTTPLNGSFIFSNQPDNGDTISVVVPGCIVTPTSETVNGGPITDIVVNCSQNDSDAGSDGGDDGGSEEAGQDAGEDAGGSDCPATAPANGDPCSNSGQWCSWGNDPRWACRQVFQCSGGTWAVQTQPPIPLGCQTVTSSCPVSEPTNLSGCTPDDDGTTCVYGQAVYTCGLCKGPTLCEGGPDGGPQWTWNSGLLSTGCPNTMPNWGTSCSVASLQCNYNQCVGYEGPGGMLGVESICTGGSWTAPTSIHCP